MKDFCVDQMVYGNVYGLHADVNPTDCLCNPSYLHFPPWRNDVK